MKPPTTKPSQPDAIDNLAISLFMAGPRDFDPEDEVHPEERNWVRYAKIKFMSRTIREFIAANYEPRRK